MSEQKSESKADKKVLDGEVVGDDPNSFFQSEAQQGDQAHAEPTTVIKKTPWLAVSLSFAALAGTATLAYMQSQQGSWAAKFQDLSADQTQLNAELSAQQKVIAQLQSQLDQQSANSDLQPQLANLTQQLEAQQVDQNNLQLQLSDQVNQVQTHLRTQLEQLLGQLSERQDTQQTEQAKQLQSLLTQLDTQTQALNQLQQNLQGLSEMSSQQQAELNQLKQQGAGQAQGMQSLQTQVERQMAQQVANQFDAMRQVQKRVQDHMASMMSMQQQSQAQTVSISAVQQQLQAYQNELQTLKSLATEENLQALKDAVGELKAESSQLMINFADLAEQAKTQTLPDWVLALENKDWSAYVSQPQADRLKAELINQVTQLQQALLDVKADLQAERAQTEELLAKPTADQVLAAKSPLTSQQLQQWLVAINSEWLLFGLAQSTQVKLQAVEQAIVQSNLDNKPALLELLAADQVMLGQAANQTETQVQWNQTFSEIKQWVAQLTTEAQTPPADEAPQTLKVTQVEPESTWEKLVDKLSTMFTLRQRSDAEATRVDVLLEQDVLKQRAYLIVERMQWAMQTQDTTILEQAKQDMARLVNTYFADRMPEWETLSQALVIASQPKRAALTLLEVWQ